MKWNNWGRQSGWMCVGLLISVFTAHRVLGDERWHVVCVCSPRVCALLKCYKTFMVYFVFYSFGFPCISPGDKPGPVEGKANEPADGQQVGRQVGVHPRDPQRGAGLLHQGRARQGPARPSL